MRAILTRYLLPLRSRAALLFCIMLVDISLDLVNPQLQRAFIDGAMGGAPVAELIRLAAIFVGIAFVLQVLYVSAGLVSTELAQTATNRMREDLLEHVLGLDLAFHGRHTPGELIERIDGDVATLANFLSRFLLELVGSALLVLGILVMLFRVDARIGATMAVFVLIAVAIMRGILHLAVPHWAAAREASAQLFGFLEERLAGTEDLRANGGVAYTLRRFFVLSREIWRRNLRATLLGSVTGGTSVLLLSIAMSISLAWAVVLVQDGSITIGTGWLLFSYSLQLNGPLSGIARQLGDLQQAGASISRIRALLAERSTVVAPSPERARALPSGPLAVDLEGVAFSYGDTSDVDHVPTLFGVTVHVPAGASLGLLGPSGSGKTTLSRLLLRLLDPTAGTVRLGGVDVRDVPLDDLRQRVAIVTQDVQLFNAPLRDNLTLFDRTIDDDCIRTALAALGLGAWVDALPEGLATVLPPGGGVSAGEAQLLAFARIFLGDPGLVVLDEASSRLDPASEARLTAAMAQLTADRTVIVIAHRLATVQRLDAVCLLDGGRVVEHGPQASLAADAGSHYARLLAVGLEDLDAAVAELAGGADDDRSGDDTDPGGGGAPSAAGAAR